MDGDTLAEMEDFEHRGGEPHVKARADESIRHRVVAAFDVEVIIGMDSSALPFAVLVGVCG